MCMLEHIRTVLPRADKKIDKATSFLLCTLGIANREFPLSSQVQGCGETGLYTLQGASYTATLVKLWWLAHGVTHSI